MVTSRAVVRICLALSAAGLLMPAAVLAEPFIEQADWAFLTEKNASGVPGSTGTGKEPEMHSVNDAAVTLTVLFRLYQLFISSQDQPSCNFTPTCSEFARRAVRKYGVVAGLVMAADRLQRCNGMGKGYYPADPASGKLYDPVK